MVTNLKTISLAVKVPVLSVSTKSMSPSSSMMEVFNTPKKRLVRGSLNCLSMVRNTPENVLMPSTKILRDMGMTKLSNRKEVKRTSPAMY